MNANELLQKHNQATLLVLDLRLHVVNRVRSLDVQRNGLASESLHKDLHPAAQTQHQVQRGLLLDVVVRKRPAVLELLAGEDEPLLIRGNTWLNILGHQSKFH